MDSKIDCYCKEKLNEVIKEWYKDGVNGVFGGTFHFLGELEDFNNFERNEELEACKSLLGFEVCYALMDVPPANCQIYIDFGSAGEFDMLEAVNNLQDRVHAAGLEFFVYHPARKSVHSKVYFHKTI